MRWLTVFGLLLGLALLVLPLSCGDTVPTNGHRPPPPPPPLEPRAGMSFRGDKAFAHVVKVVGFGARPTGSMGLAGARDYILAQLDSTGVEVELDFFDAKYPRGQRAGINIIATVPGAREEVLVIGVHYDTKDLPDFVGANDSASMCGLIIELAWQLMQREEPPPLTIRLVLFDAEEAEVDWNPPFDGLLGSTHLAET